MSSTEAQSMWDIDPGWLNTALLRAPAKGRVGRAPGRLGAAAIPDGWTVLVSDIEFASNVFSWVAQATAA